MRKVLTALVRAYQVATTNFAPRCKYYPSCSNYAITAIGRYGIKGMAMAAWRIVRCNPWSQGGVDYVDTHLDSADVKSVLLNSKKPNSIKEVVGAN
jgi:putative membrane protein insertion efficiency factor